MVSLLGLLVLLGLAYAFSAHRRQVRLRTVVWGVGLQLLFAGIILGQGPVSFVSIALFVGLVVLYLAEEELGARGPGRWRLGALALVGSAAAVASAYLLETSGVTAWLLTASALTAVVAAPLGQRRIARLAFALTLTTALGLLWARGIEGGTVLRSVSDGVKAFLELSNRGADFLFANLAKPEHETATATWPGFGFQLAFRVLPTIIFFSAFISILYYLGLVQAVIGAVARFMRWSLGTSGSETVSCSANVFVGQTEAPFLVKPFLDRMTASELHAVMVGGFATIAGGVLAAYVAMGVDPGHLIAASVMSAPAALVVAKLLYPETERSETGGAVEIPRVKTADNLVGAVTDGATDGLKLALNVAAMLIAFVALVGLVDVLLGFGDRLVDGRLLGHAQEQATGRYPGIFPASLAQLFGTLLAPLAFLMGVPWEEASAVGNLLGIKLAVNELVGYLRLAEHISAQDLSPRAVIIATYALCGFANFGSVGIQIGGIGSIAPQRRAELARLGVRAMLGGALASWTTATIAGILSPA